MTNGYQLTYIHVESFKLILFRCHSSSSGCRMFVDILLCQLQSTEASKSSIYSTQREMVCSRFQIVYFARNSRPSFRLVCTSRVDFLETSAHCFLVSKITSIARTIALLKLIENSYFSGYINSDVYDGRKDVRVQDACDQG